MTNAVAVVCWDEIYGVGSLEMDLLDRRKYAQISTIDQLSCNMIRPLFLLQQTTGRTLLDSINAGLDAVDSEDDGHAYYGRYQPHASGAAQSSQ